jgi:hypothetical protein
MGVAEINPALCSVYGFNVINEGNVTQCCRMFKNG